MKLRVESQSEGWLNAYCFRNPSIWRHSKSLRLWISPKSLPVYPPPNLSGSLWHSAFPPPSSLGRDSVHCSNGMQPSLKAPGLCMGTLHPHSIPYHSTCSQLKSFYSDSSNSLNPKVLKPNTSCLICSSFLKYSGILQKLPLDFFFHIHLQIQCFKFSSKGYFSMPHTF